MGPRFFKLCIAALLLTLGLTSAAHAAGAANDNTVLVLETTVHDGMMSPEVQYVLSLGYDVELANAAQWAAKSTADFASYRAIIFGDPVCSEGAAPIQPAVANVSTWGPAIDGNMIIIGTDPTHHTQYFPQPFELIHRSLDYVLATAAEEDRTGLYMTIACYYNGAGSGVDVDVLSYFGDFVVNQNTTCHDDIHITAPSHPAMTGIVDAELSNWNCSIHALFVEWPSNFLPLAIADGLGNEYTAPDGSTGTPYIFARTATGDCEFPPQITINGVSPDTLWSPNKKMIDITVDADVVGELVDVEVTVTSSETPKAPWTVFFEEGTDAFHFKLRADRNGNNVGRVYTITFTGTDACGQVGAVTTYVVVPHDQRGKNPRIH